MGKGWLQMNPGMENLHLLFCVSCSCFRADCMQRKTALVTWETAGGLQTRGGGFGLSNPENFLGVQRSRSFEFQNLECANSESSSSAVDDPLRLSVASRRSSQEG